jgi:catechol 2,3-dioxygenase-like lactoylglutathione lyase family enzyme
MHVSVGEINVICSNAGESLRFYRDALGFELVEQEEQAYHLQCGTTAFLLLPVAKSSPQRPKYCSVPEFSIDLMVDDIAAAHAHLIAHDAEMASTWKPGALSFFIRDPDGLVFEVIEKRV